MPQNTINKISLASIAADGDLVEHPDSYPTCNLTMILTGNLPELVKADIPNRSTHKSQLIITSHGNLQDYAVRLLELVHKATGCDLGVRIEDTITEEVPYCVPPKHYPVVLLNAGNLPENSLTRRVVANYMEQELNEFWGFHITGTCRKPEDDYIILATNYETTSPKRALMHARTLAKFIGQTLDVAVIDSPAFWDRKF